jgi:Sugar-specific transcriptional regulator TrmB.
MGKIKMVCITTKNGKEYYKALVAQKTGSDKTVEEMIEISDQSIEKCLRKLIKLQKSILIS